MKNLLILFVIGLTIFACGNGDDKKPQQTAQSASKAKKIDGGKIYKTYCVTCHGLYGDMGASGAHDLTGSILSLDERIAVITKGRNTMTPFEGLLNEEKIKAVAEFTITLKK
ncbi:MAG: cytochrome c [Bacteroidetes bacterium]|jgi:mono/diheme cytochrome c family protein|nr:cytochrome c [Bacteroidota bacterium]MDF1863220.1 cytochrome c [Saprospiraceae bacterium]